MTQEQQSLSLVWPPRYDAASFIVAACNETALAMVQNPQNCAASALMLQGQLGSGKTHLATIFTTRFDAVTITTDSDWSALMDAPNMYFVLDGADHVLSGQQNAQENLFHLYNHLVQQQKFLLLTTNAPLADYIVLPDLLSRLQSCPRVTVDNPDEETIKQTYQKLLIDRGLFVEPKVLDYITIRTERSFAAIQMIVDKIDRAALQSKRRVTIPLLTDAAIF